MNIISFIHNNNYIIAFLILALNSTTTVQPRQTEEGLSYKASWYKYGTAPKIYPSLFQYLLQHTRKHTTRRILLPQSFFFHAEEQVMVAGKAAAGKEDMQMMMMILEGTLYCAI